MPHGLNRLTIIGRLGKDPEMRYTPGGDPVTSFSVAVGNKWVGRDGTPHDDTEWFRVEAWGKLAEIINTNATKGAEVFVEGKFRSREYTDKEGVKRKDFVLRADTFLIFGGKRKEAGGEEEGAKQDGGKNTSEDDIPF